jgi:tape measure domain-containing protein
MVIQELINLIGFKVDESQLAAAERRISVAADGIERISKRLTLFLSAPLVALAGSSTVAAAKVEQFQTAFEVMLGSAQKADVLMKQLFKFEAETPFNLQQVMDFAQKLLIAKQPAETITDELKMLGDVAAGSAERLGAIVYVLGQVRALGYLQGQDIMQFTNALVPIREAISKVTGVEGKALQDMIEKRQITAEVTEKALQWVSQQRLGMMERQSKTLLGLWSSLVSALFRFRVAIGNVIIKQFQLDKLVQKSIDFLGKMETLINGLSPAMQKLAVVVGVLATALGPLLLAFSMLVKLAGKVQIALVGLFTMSKGAMAANIAVLGRFMVIGGLVLAVLAAIALAVEDFMTYMAGGQSVIGKFLEPWSELGPKVTKNLEGLLTTFQTIFSTVVEIARGTVGFILSILSGDALTASLQLEKLVNNILILIGGLFVALFQMAVKFGPILWQLIVFAADKVSHMLYTMFYSVFDNIFNFFWGKIKWVIDKISPFAGKAWKGVSEGAKSLNNTLGNITPGFYNFDPNFAFPGSSPSVPAQGKNQSLSVNSTIQMTVPEGTPQEQVKFVRSAAEKAVKEEFSRQMRGILINYPETEK